MAAKIEVRFDGPLAEVTIDNPAHRNAINRAMWTQLGQVARELGQSSEVRAVLIHGSGDVAFSAGADITDFEEARADEDSASSYDDLVEQTCREIERIPQPTIAAIRGACFGAGASVAASCDLLVAAGDAYFAVPAARLGLGYDPRGIERFLRVFGVRATRRLLLCAEKLNAETAEKLGIVDVLVSASGLLAAARSMCERIAENAPLTVRAAKFAIASQTIVRDDKRHAEAIRIAQLADASDDYKEGRAAFKERRFPRFKGS